MQAIRNVEHNKTQYRLRHSPKKDAVHAKTIGSIAQRTRLAFRAIAIRTLMALAALLSPMVGHCDSGNGWFKSLFGSKGKDMKEVATKIATLHEDEAIYITGLDFSADGKYLAATGPNAVAKPSNTQGVHIWDWKGGKIVRTFEKAEGANDGRTTESIRYSPDGRLLAACHSTGINNIVARIWNTETWSVVQDITDSLKGGCNAIDFTPDGKFLIRILARVSQSPGDSVIIYGTDTWQAIWGLRTAPYLPTALAISPDGKFLALGGMVSNPVRWQASTPVPTFGNPPLPDTPLIAIVDLTQRLIVRTERTTTMGRLAWSPDGAHIALAGAGEVAVFDAASGKEVASEPLKSAHMFVRYTPDGRYLLESDTDARGNGLGIKIWDGQHRALLQEIPGNIESLAVSRDGHYFAASSFKKISVWQLN